MADTYCIFKFSDVLIILDIFQNKHFWLSDKLECVRTYTHTCTCTVPLDLGGKVKHEMHIWCNPCCSIQLNEGLLVSFYQPSQLTNALLCKGESCGHAADAPQQEEAFPMAVSLRYQVTNKEGKESYQCDALGSCRNHKTSMYCMTSKHRHT